MHWIDERINELDALDHHNSKIENEALKIYHALWTYIEADINRANEKARFQTFKIFTEGNKALHNMVVRRAAVTPKEFHFKLDPNNYTISASGNVNVTFHLDICSGGVVCLKDGEGNEVTLPEASKLILEPFLFPELLQNK